MSDVASFRHAVRVVLALGWSDFLLKYRGSFLGYLWSFAYPLLYFLVLLHVFRPFVAENIPQYPLYLFLGIIIWEHFSVTTSSCMSMLYDKASIIQKIVFPREWLIYAVGWTTTLIFLSRFLIFVAAATLIGVPVHRGIVYLPVVFAVMVMISLGIGMLLSSFSLKFRDVSHLWNVLLQAFFWLTPIAYAPRINVPVLEGLKSLADRLWPPSWGGIMDLIIQFQPLSLVISAARRVLLPFGTPPSIVHMAGLVAIAAVVFVCGLIVFRSRSRYFVQEY